MTSPESTSPESTSTDLSGVEVGTTLGPLNVTLTRTDLVRYAGASGDFNPIHHSDHAAAAVNLPGVIGHGMLTMGLAIRLVTDWVGDSSRIRSYGVRFTKPIVVPDDGIGATVEFSGTVTAIADGIATVGINAVVTGPDGAPLKVLGAARAEVALA